MEILWEDGNNVEKIFEDGISIGEWKHYWRMEILLMDGNNVGVWKKC